MCVCVSVCSLLRYRLTVFLSPLLEVQYPNFLEIRNPWGKVLEGSGLRFKHFCFGSGLKLPRKKKYDFADLQNMVETTLPNGLETSGGRVYRLYWNISRRL